MDTWRVDDQMDNHLLSCMSDEQNDNKAATVESMRERENLVKCNE